MLQRGQGKRFKETNCFSGKKKQLPCHKGNNGMNFSLYFMNSVFKLIFTSTEIVIHNSDKEQTVPKKDVRSGIRRRMLQSQM